MKKKTPKKLTKCLIITAISIAIVWIMLSYLNVTTAKEAIYKNKKEEELLKGITHVDLETNRLSFEGRGLMRNLPGSARLEGTDGLDRVRVKDGFIWIETWNGHIDKQGNPPTNNEKYQKYDPIKKIGWRRATADNPNEQDDPGEPKDRRINIHCGNIDFITLLFKGGNDLALETPQCDGYTAEKKVEVEKTIHTNPKKNTFAEGGTGDDKINVGDGANNIDGGEGKDTIITGNGKNVVKGGKGDDKITTGTSPDFINGGEDKDTIISGDEKETEIAEGKTNFKKGDVITGGDGDDTITAGKGNDQVCGGPGEDTIKGRRGADTIRGGKDKDNIDAGRGKVLGEVDKAQGDEPEGESEEDTVVGCEEPEYCHKDFLRSSITFKDSELKTDCPDIEVGQRPPEGTQVPGGDDGTLPKPPSPGDDESPHPV